MKNGTVLQGMVDNCDSNYNLHVRFGDNIKGRYGEGYLIYGFGMSFSESTITEIKSI